MSPLVELLKLGQVELLLLKRLARMLQQRKTWLWRQDGAAHTFYMPQGMSTGPKSLSPLFSSHCVRQCSPQSAENGTAHS